MPEVRSEAQVTVETTVKIMFCSMFVCVLFALLFLVCGFQNVSAQSEGETCRTPKGTDGICRFVVDCAPAIKQIQKGQLPSVCGFVGQRPLVCCTGEGLDPIKTNAADLLLTESISKKKCKEYAQYAFAKEGSPSNLTSSNSHCPFQKESLLAGGATFAEKHEFPHMVQIGFALENGVAWRCSGTIISESYVLTAAHCLIHRALGEARYIRAGIINFSQTNFQQRNITNRIAHPQFIWSKFYHDIALLKVHPAFELNPTVRPACLYTDKHLPNKRLVVSGWYEGDLMKSPIEEVPVKKCNETYESNIRTSSKLSDGIVDEYMFCGSTINEKNRCLDDSGNPLQYYSNDPDCMYNTIGVTSFGLSCGSENVPAVYTRVSSYTKWIEDIVWPSK